MRALLTWAARSVWARAWVKSSAYVGLSLGVALRDEFCSSMSLYAVIMGSRVSTWLGVRVRVRIRVNWG